MPLPFITEVAKHLQSGLPALAATLLLLIIARYVFLATAPFKTVPALLDDENAAIGVVFAAYLFGVALALVGTMFGRGQEEVWVRVGKILVEGVLAIALIRISIWVNDRFILHRFCAVKEIRDDRNLGVAFCVAGSCIACGLILNGALTGFSRGFVYGLRDIVIFWLLGQVAFVLGGYVYHRITKYDVHQLIEYDDNVAVGICFGAFLTSLGLVVRASLVGAGLDKLTQELPRTMLLLLAGVVSVFAVHMLAMRLVLGKANYEDEVEMHGNVAVSIVAACASLAAAVLLASVLQR